MLSMENLGAAAPEPESEPDPAIPNGASKGELILLAGPTPEEPKEDSPTQEPVSDPGRDDTYDWPR